MPLEVALIKVKPTEVFEANITHNLSKMWNEAGCGDALYDSDGKRAGDLLPDLRKALETLESDPARFKTFDAPNGWGTYEQAIPWLKRLIHACFEHQDAIVRLSK